MKRIIEPWVTEPATQKVCAALTEAGAQALFVGGCVRNALLGEPVSDIDIATDAPPERVMQLARHAGLKAIPTGIDHGTITVVCHGIAHEITTFRRDVQTDGRRAVVAFSDKVEEDAARRDFTMNAIYAAPDGTVRDPLNGLPDLKARRVRFIGTAEHRIREALSELTANRASIIIAHRLSSLMYADEILFLDAGRIVERGSHEELMRQNGRYAALYALQARSGSLSEEAPK